MHFSCRHDATELNLAYPSFMINYQRMYECTKQKLEREKNTPRNVTSKILIFFQHIGQMLLTVLTICGIEWLILC